MKIIPIDISIGVGTNRRTFHIACIGGVAETYRIFNGRFEISNFDAGVRMCVSKTVKFVIQGCTELIRQIGDTCRRSRVTPFGCIAHIRYIGDQKFACASVVQFIHQSPNISWCIG